MPTREAVVLKRRAERAVFHASTPARRAELLEAHITKHHFVAARNRVSLEAHRHFRILESAMVRTDASPLHKPV